VVTDMWVAGSLATGDYHPGVSDLDLVAIVSAPVSPEPFHDGIDPALKLGCVYVPESRLADTAAEHPTWTHGLLVQRGLSGVTRAELVRHGYAVFGRPPASVLPPVTDDDVRDAARAELAGYWTRAIRKPRPWLDPMVVDLGLTTMSRARHAIATGQLLTKTDAIAQAAAPRWLIAQMHARRRGEPVVSPRLPAAWLAWRDARRTIRAASPRSPG
jgi:hypothetical protein